MAAFIRTGLKDNFRNLDRSARQHLLNAIAGGSDAADKSLAANVLGLPHFIIEGTTDSNTAALNAGAAQSFSLNFATETEVTFVNGFDRDIYIEVTSRDETTRNYQFIKQTVRGGAVDPTLVDGVKNLSPKVGGQVTFAVTSGDATAVHAYGGFSITTAEAADGRYAAAIPKARRVIPTALNISAVGTGTLAAAAAQLNLNAITLATGVIELGVRNGAGANVQPAATDVANVEFDVLPVENPELAIVTTTTPDQVIIGAVGQASENVRWTINVWVSDLYPNNLATASE